MKKHILTFALITAIIGSVTVGCSSQKNTGSSDTTKKDTTKIMSKPADTMKKDTVMKKDTTHH
jgi:hypothetical protein